MTVGSFPKESEQTNYVKMAESIRLVCVKSADNTYYKTPSQY